MSGFGGTLGRRAVAEERPRQVIPERCDECQRPLLGFRAFYRRTDSPGGLCKWCGARRIQLLAKLVYTKVVP